MKDRVLIVGGGPAGLYAAYILAKNNVDAIVFEKDKEIGVPILCAEGISNRTLELFFNNKDYDFIRNKFNKLILKYEDKYSETLIPDMGVIVNRTKFDKYIAKKAIDNGAKIKLNAMCIEAGYDKNGIFVKTENECFNGSALIIADGVESRIGKFFNIDTVCKTDDIYSCYEYVVKDKKINDNEIVFDFSPEYAQNGYVWIFPRGNNIANIGIGINPNKNTKTAKYLLDCFMEKHFHNGQIIKEKAGGVPVNYIKKPFANRVLVCGDAGRFADPITGGGIDNAIRTGLYAANTLIYAIQRNDYSEKTMEYYFNQIKKDNLKSLNMQYKLKNILENMSFEEQKYFFISLIESIDKKSLLANDFYSIFETFVGKIKFVGNLFSFIITLLSKPILIKTLIKVLWKY